MENNSNISTGGGSGSNNRSDYDNRKLIFVGALIVVSLAFIARLFYLQLVDTDYKAWADSNAFLKKSLYPARGMIYDRNGKLLVYNRPAYDLMLIMREVQPFDTLDFCRTVGLTKEQVVQRFREIKDPHLNPNYSSYVPQIFMNQLTPEEYGVLEEKLYKFPGFYIQNRTIREYNYPYAAHILGNIGEVNRSDLEKDDYYVSGDYSGRSGVERSYEKILRGVKGVEIMLRDAHGRIKGKYLNGAADFAPQSGRNLTLSLDMDLQAYGEKLMQNKLGGIVMIDTETGEILCMVSAPTYDPEMLVGKMRGKNHEMLEKNPHKPLFDRTIMASYPPGSTFKPSQGLIFLQEGVITPETYFPCAHGYTFLHGHPACHGHPSPINLVNALATSCNSYFSWGFHTMIDNRRRYGSVQKAFEIWKNYIISMGYGYKLGVDLPGEKRGYIPNSKVYDKIYHKHWNSSTIISIAIGQGEILTTPLQICNFAATVANRGYFITPHVVRSIEGMPLDSLYTHRRYTKVERRWYEYIAAGMRASVTGTAYGGTSRGVALPDIEVCGKTGTAENPHGKDHSVFMGFAPYHNPKIAISVFVENAGFGADVAVPIARLMLNKYFHGDKATGNEAMESRIENTVILPSGAI